MCVTGTYIFIYIYIKGALKGYAYIFLHLAESVPGRACMLGHIFEALFCIPLNNNRGVYEIVTDDIGFVPQPPCHGAFAR